MPKVLDLLVKPENQSVEKMKMSNESRLERKKVRIVMKKRGGERYEWMKREKEDFKVPPLSRKQQKGL